nr:MAG TPA: hypothetical protein [Caudoviricetes sp.]
MTSGCAVSLPLVSFFIIFSSPCILPLCVGA